jgi:uncharacterized lipoprotein YmbA
MTHRPQRLIPLLAALSLTACASSPPTRYYALEPVATGGGPQQVSGTPVKIDAVHIPPALDRSSMVRGESGDRLDISSRDEWAGDLGEMARRVLTQDLAERLPSGMVIGPHSPAPVDARGIVVDILTFQPQGSGEVTLDAAWTLLQGTQSNPVLRRLVHLSTSAPASAGGEAAAMSTLLGKLADRMAPAIGAVRSAAR